MRHKLSRKLPLESRGLIRSAHRGVDRRPRALELTPESLALAAARVDTTNDHGTGCSLSAAIAAHLALGASPIDAVERAKSYVHQALLGAARWQLGSGHGPIDHFGWGEGPPPSR